MSDIYSIMGTTGGALLIGLLSGFIAKKLINVFAFVVGIQIAFFAYMEYINIITINWDLINRFISTMHEMLVTLRFPDDVESIEFIMAGGTIGGFSFGFFIGFFYI